MRNQRFNNICEFIMRLVIFSLGVICIVISVVQRIYWIGLIGIPLVFFALAYDRLESINYPGGGLKFAKMMSEDFVKLDETIKQSLVDIAAGQAMILMATDAAGKEIEEIAHTVKQEIGKKTQDAIIEVETARSYGEAKAAVVNATTGTSTITTNAIKDLYSWSQTGFIIRGRKGLLDIEPLDDQGEKP